MRDALLAEPTGTAWLMATGALTNVANLVDMYPEVIAHLKGLSIMGGSIGQGFVNEIASVSDKEERIGNTGPWAEFNIYVRGLSQIYGSAHAMLTMSLVRPRSSLRSSLASRACQENHLNYPRSHAPSPSHPEGTRSDPPQEPRPLQAPRHKQLDHPAPLSRHHHLLQANLQRKLRSVRRAPFTRSDRRRCGSRRPV